jgi:peptidoglycan/xylan/chitin deacetylase (PgdA/CDA1 family)
MKRRRFLRQVAALTVGLLFPAELVRASERTPDLGSGLLLPVAQTGSADSTIYLTFDDGYVGLGDKIAALAALNVLGTFFLTGQAIYNHPGDVQALVDAGHILGNHTYDHADLTKLGFTGITSDIQRCENAALNVAGVSTLPLMRPPYGAVNGTVRSVAAAMGYRSILWNWDTRDWAGSSVSYIEQNVGTGIVLMHTQGRNTIAALSDLVPSLAAQGYTFDVL